ncbi:MAG: extracellular solute-binding protein [Lachnospiraceae bacterium]|nr:extracellular solute-binding protein [Lachnospiraceae bacterium]
MDVKLERKIKYGICFFLMFAVLLSDKDVLKRIPGNSNTKLTIGVFSDSYRGTPNGFAHKIINDAIEKYEKDHPDIEVIYETGILKEDYSEWLAEQIMQGKAPDVFFILPEDFNTLHDVGALENMDDFIRSDGEFDKDRFYEAAYNSGRVDESQYSLPFECTPELMFVNRTLLDSEGISMPKQDWTWDDLLRICKIASKDRDLNGTPDHYGVARYGWQEAFASNDVTLFNEEGTECYFTDEKVSDALSFLDAIDEYSIGNTATEDYFEHGDVVFQPMYYSNYRAYELNPIHASRYAEFNWGYLTMPAGDKGDNSSMLDTLSVAMYSGSTMKKEAWDMIKILIGDEEIQSEIFEYSEGVSPVKKITENELMKDSEQSYESVTYAMEHAVTDHRFYGYNEALNAVDISVQEILNSNGNIRMDQIIQSRSINTFLKTLNNN